MAPHIEARALGVLRGRHDHCGRAVDDARSVACGDGAVLAEGRAQLGETFQSRVGLDVIVGADELVTLAALDRHGHDFGRKTATLHGLGAQLVAAQGVLVLLLARDAQTLGDLLGGLGHVEPADRIHQRCEERVDDGLLLTEAHARTHAVDDVRSLAHVLHAAGEHRGRFTQLQELRARHDRLQAGTAQAIHGQSRHMLRHTSLQTHMARAVQRIDRGLQRVAHDHMIDGFRGHFRTLQSSLRSNRGQLHGGEVLELAVARCADVLGHGGTGAADDDDVACHECFTEVAGGGWKKNRPQTQRPMNFAGRFSKKALMPSFMSAVVEARPNMSDSMISPSC